MDQDSQNIRPEGPRPATATFRIRPFMPEDVQAVLEVREHFINTSLRSRYSAEALTLQQQAELLATWKDRHHAVLIAESSYVRRGTSSRASGVSQTGKAILGFAVCSHGQLPESPAGYLEVYTPGPVREVGDHLVEGALIDEALSYFIQHKPQVESVAVETPFGQDLEELQSFVRNLEKRSFAPVATGQKVCGKNGVLLDALFLWRRSHGQVYYDV